MRIGAGGDVDEIEPLAVEHRFGCRIRMRGRLSGARQVRIRRGGQFHLRNPPPAFDVELGEETATDDAAAQRKGRGHPCYYSIHGVPTWERSN